MSQEVTAFDQLKADIAVFVSPVNKIIVTDVASGQVAIAILQTIKGYQDKLEATRKALVTPMNNEVKRINAYAKGLEDPLAQAERHAKAQLAAFEAGQEKIRQQKMREEEDRRRAEERKAAEERAKIEAEAEAKRKAELAAVDQQSDFDELFGEGGGDKEAARKEIEERQARETAEREAELQRQAKVREGEAKARQWDIDATRVKGAKKVWKCEAVDLAKVPREFLVITLNNAAVLAAARNGVAEIPGVKLWQETQIAVGPHTSLNALPDPEAFENFKG